MTDKRTYIEPDLIRLSDDILYTQLGVVDDPKLGKYNENGAVDRYQTEIFDRSTLLGREFDGLLKVLLSRLGKSAHCVQIGDQILITTRSHWSGYSEYTITQTWDEIVITIPSIRAEFEWHSVSKFLKAVAESCTDRGYQSYL